MRGNFDSLNTGWLLRKTVGRGVSREIIYIAAVGINTAL